MARLIGLDVGTSGCKAVLVDETGRLLGQANAEYGLSVPRPGWSEQDPEDWWRAAQTCLERLGERRPDAVGLTGQMHGAVFLDASDAPIRPAILWNDARTEEECAEIDAAIGPETVRQITGNPPLTGFQLPKVLWLRNHELSRYLRVKSVLLPKDYVRLRLTGTKATDVSDASGTGAFDVGHRRWSNRMLSGLEVDPSWFPRAYESYEVAGETRAGALEAGVPVAAGGGDQAAGAVGTGAVEPGVVSVSLGTSGVVFTTLERFEADPEGRAHTFCHANGGWHAMSVMLSCGGALRWARDTFFPNDDYAALNALAEQAPLGADGAAFLPYLTGERSPVNDPAARGVLAGLSLATDRARLARALFEGLTLGLMDGAEVLKGLGARFDQVLVTGGGAKGPFWVRALSDALGAPAVRPEVEEGPAYGAALLAGVSVGVWPDVGTACRQTLRYGAPLAGPGDSYGPLLARYRDLYRATREWNRRYPS